jgi:hypothetical protein
MSGISKLSVLLSSALIATVVIGFQGQAAMACSAGSSGLSHGSAVNRSSVTICVGVGSTTPGSTTVTSIPVSSSSKSTAPRKSTPAKAVPCPSPAQLRYIPRSADAAERWIQSLCGTPAKKAAAPKPAAIPPATTTVRTTTPSTFSFTSASVTFPPKPLIASIQPTGKLLPGQVFTLTSDPSVHVGTQMILGNQAEVLFTPAFVGWTFSDGSRQLGPVVSRSFDTAGMYQVRASASYYVSYRIVGQTNWTPATGEIVVTSNLLELEVDGRYPGQNPALRGALLVAGDCLEKPSSFGC